jgi:hypothetical protein
VLAAAESETPRDVSERAEVVMKVHSTLRRLSAEQRKRGRAERGASVDPPLGESAASGRR